MHRLQSILSSEKGSESDQETPEQSSNLNRDGRPQNWFRRTHFVDSGAISSHNRITFECKHCDAAVSSRVKDVTAIGTF